MVDGIEQKKPFFNPRALQLYKADAAVPANPFFDQSPGFSKTDFSENSSNTTSFRLRDLVNQNLQDQGEIAGLRQREGLVNGVFDAIVEFQSEVVRNGDADGLIKDLDAVREKLAGTITTVNNLSNDAISKGWTTANDLNSASLGLNQLNLEEKVTEISSRLDSIVNNLASKRQLASERIIFLSRKLEDRQSSIAKILENPEKSQPIADLETAISLNERMKNQLVSSNLSNLIQAFSLNSIQPNQVFNLLNG
ncbi:hypothetical protein HYY75_04160 [bacterium]|nr:hypothetical protein [bacterium]